jgi:hypothetical protein
MKGRAMAVKEALKNKKYESVWEPYPFNAGYFMCIKLKNVGSEKLRSHLLDKYGVGTISTAETDLRIAFSSIEKEQAADLFECIYNGAKDLS